MRKSPRFRAGLCALVCSAFSSIAFAQRLFTTHEDFGSGELTPFWLGAGSAPATSRDLDGDYFNGLGNSIASRAAATPGALGSSGEFHQIAASSVIDNGSFFTATYDLPALSTKSAFSVGVAGATDASGVFVLDNIRVPEPSMLGATGRRAGFRRGSAPENLIVNVLQAMLIVSDEHDRAAWGESRHEDRDSPVAGFQRACFLRAIAIGNRKQLT